LLRIFGVPIKVDVSFFVLAVVLASGRASHFWLLAEWLVVLLFSILLHELGHALTGRRFGLSPSISLYSMGGLTSWKNTVDLEPAKYLIISLAGPAAGLLLGGILLFCGQLFDFDNSVLSVAYHDLLWVNIGWSIFNLLPMLPLDGGQVLITLESWLLAKKAQTVSHAISLLVALAITSWALSRNSVWIAILGAWFSVTNGKYLWQKIQAHRDQELRRDVDRARQEIRSEQFDSALSRTEMVRTEARTDSLRREAAQLVIFIFIQQGKYKEAEEELGRFDILFGEDHYLKGLNYFHTGNMSGALLHLRIVFDQSPTKEVGLILNHALIAERNYSEVLKLAGHSVLADVRWELYVDLQTEAFNGADFAVSTQAGLLASQIRTDAEIAYNLACAFARDAKPQVALDWLARAVAAGFKNRDLVASDADLDSLRSFPEFDLIVGKLQ
jgi:Zn-dependent protease